MPLQDVGLPRTHPVDEISEDAEIWRDEKLTLAT